MSNELFGVLIETVIAGILLVTPLAIIFKKAGFHPALSLLIFLPVVGFFAVLMILGLRAWPKIQGEA